MEVNGSSKTFADKFFAGNAMQLLLKKGPKSWQ